MVHMMSGLRFFVTLLFASCWLLTGAQAQTASIPVNETVKTARPFRITTAGKQITIKSSKDIKSIMVWTAGGHRVLEQKDINSGNFTFRITIEAKIFFVMVQLIDGKTYSEKIGVQ